MTDSLREQLQATLGSSYAIERELGGGGMSRVFVASETRLKRKVVIKMLSPELAAGLSAERFEREIQLAASLQQANIVPVLSAGDSGGLPFYTMPYVEGEALRARLAAGVPMPVQEVTAILRDVVHALEYAHARGVVHRDIKPDNILLSGGTAVVTDFGIAKALSAAGVARRDAGATGLTQVGTAIGTPAYMSPEQAAGDPDVDQRSDIYAFGCVAFELLAGAPPFAGRTPSRTLAAHMAEVPRDVTELRPDTPPGLAALIARCLEKEPSARPQSAAEISRALSAITSGTSLESMPASAFGGPGAFKRALLMYAGAFVFVAIVAKAAQVSLDNAPQWFFSGAIALMTAGLPVLLFAGWAHRTHRRTAMATPTGTGSATHGTAATLAMKATPHLRWTRLVRFGGYAMASFIAIVAGYMVLRAFGIGPAGSLMAREGWQDNDRLLVTSFSAKGGADTALGSVVSEGVRTDLGQARGTLAVMPVSAVRGALQRMTLPPDATLTLAVAMQLAQREGVKAIVDGDITQFGTGYILTGRIINPATGDELAVYHENANTPDELIPAVQRLTRDLRKRMGESLKRVTASPALDAVTTSSLEALKKYSAGVQAADSRRDYDEAAKLFRQATAIDSNFGMAWRKLGVSLSNGGKPQPQIDSAVSRAFALRDRMTEHEKWLATGYYYQSGPMPDRAKAIEAYEHIVGDGPPDAATHNLGMLRVSKRDYVGAESLFRARLRGGEVNVSTDQLINTLIYLGKIDQADSVRADATRRAPQQFSELDELGLLYMRGNVDSIYRIGMTDAASKDPKKAIPGMGTMASIDLLHGKVNKAIAGVAKLTLLRTSTGGIDNPLSDSIGMGWLRFLITQDTAAVVATIERGMKVQPIMSIPAANRPVVSMAELYAVSGHPAKAREVLQRYDTDVPDQKTRVQFILARHEAMGEILLAEHKPLEAVAEFKKADSLPDGPANASPMALYMNLARAYDAANKPDSAIAYFEKWVGANDPTRGNDFNDPLNLAGTSRRLGELYEQKGDRAKAIASYQRFVNLWKDADASLQPQVANVKRRIDLLMKHDG